MQQDLLGENVKISDVKMSPLSWKGEKKRTEQVPLDRERNEQGKYITEDDKKYPKEYCIKMIEAEPSLWDMRCWDKYKDVNEIKVWIRGKNYHNCGHAFFCIRRLLDKGLATEEEIIEAIMKNPHKTFSRRIVKCWDTPNNCPKFMKQKHYGNGICENCK